MTFTKEQLVSPPGQPNELYNGTYMYAICCDRSKGCDCNDATDYPELPWFVNRARYGVV